MLKTTAFTRLLLLLLTIPFVSKAQLINNKESLPVNYFSPPVDIPMYLAGNFAELRSNHFHGGIDIKTQGVEGKNILAAAEGYVSRIKVQEGGYGKVIYIDHPNGYTTAYAHLSAFSDKIDAFVKTEQYHNQSYTVNFYPEPNSIVVKKGEIIALSGNSGGSGGPHLHFEIRETATEHPLNVLLFNFPIKDNIAPIIRGIRIYPLGETASVNNRPTPVYLPAIKVGDKYAIKTTPVVANEIGFGIETLDLINGSGNRCGVFNIKLIVDDELIFEQETFKVPFDESRYLNSHTDYAYKKSNSKWIHKSFIEPNNQLSIYKTSVRNGHINFKTNGTHKIKYIVSDAYGNTSQLELDVNANQRASLMKKPVHANFAKKLQYHKMNEFKADGFLMNLPKNALYQDIDLKYTTSVHPSGRWSAIHHLHSDDVPLHKNAELYIKCDFPPEVPTSKLLAIRKTSSGSVRTHVGDYAVGYYSFETRYFGSFYIYHDTIKPVIKPINIYNGKNISGQSKFDFTITDNLAGIKSYNCYINDEWVLMEYDYKRNRLTHYKHGKIPKGKNNLKLVVIDAVGNTKVYKCWFLN